MHIPDGWIDLPTSAAAGTAAVGSVAAAGRRAAVRLKARATTFPAVVAAYLLVAQMAAIPVAFGTSAHLIGAGLATALVGPALAIVCATVVVLAQALLFADGGVTALGLNIVDNAVVPCLVAAAVLSVAAKNSRLSPLSCSERGQKGAGTRILAPYALLAGAAAFAATMAAAGVTALEFVVGGTDVVPDGAVAATLGAAHLVVAALEAVLTAGVVQVVVRLRPDLVRRPLPAPAPVEEPA